MRVTRSALFAPCASVIVFGCGDAPPPPAATPEQHVVSVAAAVPSATPSPAPEAPAPPPLPAVELVQVAPAPPPAKMPRVEVLAPTKNQIVAAPKAGALQIKLRVKDWELAAGGDHLCVMLDRGPCKPVTDLAKAPTLGELGVPIDEGSHVIVAFARRGSVESVKPVRKAAAFAVVPFFVGKRAPPVYKDGAPILVLDIGSASPPPPEGVLIDCYVANAEIAEGKYVVHASVGGPGLGPGVGVSASSLAPFRLKNAQPGEHLVRFALFEFQPNLEASGSSTTVSYGSKPVDGPFAVMTRSFTVTTR